MSWVQANKTGGRSAPHNVDMHTTKSKIARSATLTLYDDLPAGEISIEEFERFAMERLRVLKGIEDLRARNARPEEIQEGALHLFQKHLQGSTREDTLRKDAISHHVLRLAYCRTEDLRRWFLAQECDLFKARFKQLLPAEQRSFLESSGLPFRATTVEEFAAVKDSLAKTHLAVTGSRVGAQQLSTMDTSSSTATAIPISDSFFKVPFEQVPDLVATRKVYIQEGWAYVSKDQLSSLVGAPFRAKMSKALVITARRWAATVAPSEADRLAPIVESLSQRYLGVDYTDPEKRGVLGTVTATDIPTLSRQSFPLCMQNMYAALRESGHLKHDGRMQFGLFLKGVGLPLEEAVKFWRMMMAQTAPGEKFDKEYLYNVRHNYGKEGKRKDYTPYSCSRVINAVPGVGQVHGCPYRTFAPEALRTALSRAGVEGAKVEEAVTKAKGGHYQLACASAWEGAHGGCECEAGINHPNQYFEESRRVTKEREAGAAAGGEGGNNNAPTAEIKARYDRNRTNESNNISEVEMQEPGSAPAKLA